MILAGGSLHFPALDCQAYVFLNYPGISFNRIHIISAALKVTVTVLILEIYVPVKYH